MSYNADQNSLKECFEFAKNNGELFVKELKQFKNYRTDCFYNSDLESYIMGDLLFTKAISEGETTYDIATNKITNSDDLQSTKELGNIYKKFKSLQTWVLCEEYIDFCSVHTKEYTFAKISKPVFGLFYVFDYWNVGMSMDIILPIRAKDKNSDKSHIYTDLNTVNIGIFNSGFSHIIQTWDYKPSFKELRQAFKKSNYHNIKI